ncbi:hypothetical protein ACI798_12850 [Geodermatophilus sp. SYSU D01045]
MGKLSLGLGLGVGFVLGARAGRERYEQIAKTARDLLGRPEVQQTLEKAREAAPAPLQGSIDKLTGQASGGSSTGGGMSGGTSGGTVDAGTLAAGSNADAVVPPTPPTVAEAFVLEDADVETPTTPAADTRTTGGTAGPVPDPLIPPAKSGQ